MALLLQILAFTLILYYGECDYEIPPVRYEEVLVPRFGNATLRCEFSFIEGTYDLGFRWLREDIIEVIEVSDINAFIQQRYEYKEPQVVFSYNRNRVELEEQSHRYEDRVRVDTSEIADGDLTLQLNNVDYEDEGLYTCSAISPHGKGEIKMKLMIQEEEEPPVTIETIDNSTVARCTSSAWYKVPIVKWLNRRDEDITGNSTMAVVEEIQDGRHRVTSTLAGVKSHEIYRCLIRDAKKARRLRTYHRKLKKEVLRQHGEF
ncbi:butyrophilin subfamily 2 member A2-like [Pelodytes ibericus]